MDINQWKSVFSSIVSRAITLEVLSTGVAGNYNGALQVMIVDVSLDNLMPSLMDDKSVHSIYKALVNSGLAFGARRWVAILDRQCERLASVMANNISAGDVGVGPWPLGIVAIDMVTRKIYHLDPLSDGRPANGE
ncbi:hypothetical protein OROGR_029869 [Orobanche gracilis]